MEGDEGPPPKKQFTIDITKPVFGPLRKQLFAIPALTLPPPRNYAEEVRYTVEEDLRLQLLNEAKEKEA